MKKNLLATIAIFVCFVTNSFSQSHTEADLAVNKFQTLYNTNQPESIFNMLSDKIKTLMPLDKTTQAMAQLRQQMGELKSYSFSKQEQPLSYYKAVFEKTTLTLVVSVDKDNKLEAFRFIPYKDEKQTAEKSNFIYKSPDGDISGSLVLPEGTKPVPVVLFIAGSGPTDRDCNQVGMTCNAFKMLADSLRKAGIASVRYDKRGVGESMGAVKSVDKVTFDDMVNDAVGFIQMLKADKRFSKVIVLGHSEGSLIGMIAANKEPVSAYISVAGIADKIDKVLEQQLSITSPDRSKRATRILDSLAGGFPVKYIDSDLNFLFPPYMNNYFISWLKYEPKVEIKKLSIPVLILQGTSDIQVTVAEAQKLKKAYPKATYTAIEGMSHVLKLGPKDREQNGATYNMPDLPLCAGFVPAITGFVQKAASN